MVSVVAKITTGVLIVAGIGLASGVIPRAWRYTVDYANGFWVLAAIIFLLDAVCLFFTIGVFWFSPERQPIPKNQLTSRIKQYIKISVSVAAFGMSAFWGALAGEMMTGLHDKGFRTEDAHHLLVKSSVHRSLPSLLAIYGLSAETTACERRPSCGTSSTANPVRRNIWMRTNFGMSSLTRWMHSPRVIVPLGLFFTSPVIFTGFTFAAIIELLGLKVGA
ncbi:hypothetical protein DDJ91_12560 [Mycobacteroides abscessus]|nr:hypothetical protein M879_21615 [Mycobacteroides abscessus V06705]PVB39076.1 hypothetical protein DDJ91_12560 [Mycobacteroides abscessus]